MSKKKQSFNEKKLRREVEILKSQLKATGNDLNTATKVSSKSDSSFEQVVVSAKETKEAKYDLPINHIRHDLNKTILYAVFAVGFLVILSLSNIKY